MTERRALIQSNWLQMHANKREIFLTNGSFKDGIEIQMNGLLQRQPTWKEMKMFLYVGM